MHPISSFKSKREAALYWYKFGYKIIPIVPGEKRPAVKHYPWLDTVSCKQIKHHWAQHPDHDIGAVLDVDVLVLDADTPEALKALELREKEFGIVPFLEVATTRGAHHHVGLKSGVFAKTDSHDSTIFPAGIDIRAKGSSIILPPTESKSIKCLRAKSIEDVERADQWFVDCVFWHNERPAPRPPKSARKQKRSKAMDANLSGLGEVLEYIDPDLGYRDWTYTLMAIFHYTQGSEAGLDLADEWSSRGDKYRGRDELETKWRSFSQDTPRPITFSWLYRLAELGGADVPTIMMKGQDEFEILEDETEIIGRELEIVSEHPFSRFLLNGSSAAMASELKDASFVMDGIALSGQITVIFAPPNTGKTLITLYCIRHAIDQGWINGSDVFYINLDDTAHGLVEKLKIAEECGFGMLCDGYNGFNVNEFAKYIAGVTESGDAGRTIIILDTAKKFTNLMDKGIASRFSSLLRKFSTKGGTGIALTHTNKHPSGGKGVPGGTSDLLDDCDCGYVIDPVSDEGGNRVVEFRNVKRRGPVAKSVAFRYSTAIGISYRDLLDSVQVVGADNLGAAKQATELQADAPIIAAVTSCIVEGITTKMEIKVDGSRRANCSHNQTMAVVDRYTGDDPAKHLWNFIRGAHGRQCYQLLARPDHDHGGAP